MGLLGWGGRGVGGWAYGRIRGGWGYGSHRSTTGRGARYRRADMVPAGGGARSVPACERARGVWGPALTAGSGSKRAAAGAGPGAGSELAARPPSRGPGNGRSRARTLRGSRPRRRPGPAGRGRATAGAVRSALRSGPAEGRRPAGRYGRSRAHTLSTRSRGACRRRRTGRPAPGRRGTAG